MAGAVQAHFTTAVTSMTSGTELSQGNAAQPVEVDAKAIETPDREISDRPPVVPRKTLWGWLRRPPAVPRETLRGRLRRPLLILFPILLAAVGAAYYLAEEPYVSTDDAFVRAAKESINARVAGQAVEIAVRDNQRVQQGQAPVPDRSGTLPDCGRSGRGAARQRASPNRRAQSDLPPATGRTTIGQRFRGLRPA